MSSGTPIEVLGGGLAARAAAAALRRRGLAVRLIPGPPGRGGPTLLLNDVCRSLLADLFPGLSLRGQPVVERRVRWGEPAVRATAERSIVVETGALLSALEIPGLEVAQVPSGEGWTIYAGPLVPGARQIVGGARSLVAAPVEAFELGPRVLVEAVPGGWLMLAPTGPGAGTLQGVVPRLRGDPGRVLVRLLRASELIAPRVQLPSGGAVGATVWPSAAAIGWPLAGDGWLAVGRGAAALDPISGEGGPFAIRTALLAAAAIAGIEDGSLTRAEALTHYRHRVALTALGHLKACAGFYAAAFPDHLGWREEIRQLAAAHAALLAASDPPPPEGLMLEVRAGGLVRR